MKLNIVQPESARVTLPVRLCVRPQDLGAFQAHTLTHNTFTEAAVDFGPDDFANDSERLAARDLALILQRESTHVNTGWQKHPTGSLIPGVIAIEAAFPFDELAIQESLKDVVRLAGVQRNVAVGVLGHLEAYAALTHKELSAKIAEACRLYEQPVATFQELCSTTSSDRLKALDEKQLLSLTDQLVALAAQLPSPSDLEALLRKSIPEYPAPVTSVSFSVDDEMGYGAFLMDKSALLRSDCTPPKASVIVTVRHANDLCCTSSEWKVEIYASVVGSYIADFAGTEIFEIDLFPLLGIHEVIDRLPEEDFQAMGGAEKAALLVRLYEDKRDSRGPLSDIGRALSRIADERNQAEASEWIAAHGSEALKLGSDLDYSMVRKYRLERAQLVLAGLLSEISGWEIALCKDLDSVYFPHKKASPSERALRAATAILPVAPNTTIYYAERISNTLQPEDGEYLKIEEGELFSGAPAYVLFWPDRHAVPKGPQATSKARKPRRKPG